MHPLSNDALRDLLVSWLEIDSTSGQEAQFLVELETFLSAAGFQISRQAVAENRWNLLAYTHSPIRVLFTTHVDTVPPFLSVRRTSTALYGRGACDTKGGIVAMLQAGLKLLEQGRNDIGFLFVVGEEVDHCGAKIAQSLDISPQQIILCEPTCNRLVEAQKGMLRVALNAKGVAGHSAYPQRGESAINYMLDALHRLRRHDWPTSAILGPTTFNVGTFQGGVAANVFAPEAKAELLFRAVSPVDQLLDDVRRLCGERVEVALLASNDPVFFTIPEDYDTCVVPFNTDATYLQSLGNIWLVGPGNIECAHSDDEHIQYSDLLAGVELYFELANRVSFP